jgi:dTDP-4-dehydrorhamnose reductase
MKIFLSGSKGMLGSYCYSQLVQKGCDVIAAKREFFDLNDPEACYQEIVKQAPDVVVHLAAETNVDLCETNPAHAALFNSLSTEAVAKAASQINARIVYVSTSNVFGHEGRQSYNELDMPHPVNYYGKSKLLGECLIKKHCPKDHLIVRSGWMIGGGRDKDHKFVGKIVQQIKSGADTLTAVDDKFGSITPASKLADFLAWALEINLTGTYHYASKGGVSRFQIAKFAADLLGFQGKVMPVKSSSYPLAAPRPVFETIESILLKSVHGAPIINDWMEDLTNYVNELSK